MRVTTSVFTVLTAVHLDNRAAVICRDAATVDLSGDGGCLCSVLRQPLPGAAAALPGLIATVHFTAAVANGAVIHDSKAAGDPLEVRVGGDPKDTVSFAPTADSSPGAPLPATDSAVDHLTQVPGWELALPRMRVGEVVRLSCAPQYAYGELGAPPLIPPNSQMQFELELVSLRDLRSSHNPEEVRKGGGGGSCRARARAHGFRLHLQLSLPP